MQTLSAYIAKKNEATRAWVAAGENRWAGMLCEDAAHWLAYGITTPAQFDHYMLVVDVYEMTRSAYGYKPSWSGLMDKTDAELSDMLPALAKACAEEIERCEELERLEMEFEQREEQKHAEAMRAAMTREEWTLGTAFALAGI